MGCMCAAPIQDSFNNASQKRDIADCNGSSNDEDSRKHKIAKLHTVATAAKLV